MNVAHQCLCHSAKSDVQKGTQMDVQNHWTLLEVLGTFLALPLHSSFFGELSGALFCFGSIFKLEKYSKCYVT